MKSIKVKEEIKSDSSPLPSEKSDEDDEKVRMCFRRIFIISNIFIFILERHIACFSIFNI